MANIMDDVEDNEQGRFLFTGDPSSGKSIAAASFPGIYIFDFDERWKSVKKYWGVERNKTDIHFDTYRVGDFKTLDKKIDGLISYCPFDAIALDSLTFLVDIILTQIRNVKGQLNPGDKGAGKFVAGFKVNDIEDYMAEAGALESLLQATRLIKANIILTAHLVPKFGTGQRVVFTAGSKIAAKIPGSFNEIHNFNVTPGFTANDPTRYTFNTVSNGVDFARTVTDLPPVVDITGQSYYEIVNPYMKAPLKRRVSPDAVIDFSTGQVTETKSNGF